MIDHDFLPVWLEQSIYELAKDVCEIPGSEAHPRILEYLESVLIKATDDEIHWCSAALNCIIKECGLKGTDNASARSWIKWGKPIDGFKTGAIAVFWRESKDSWKGHVGIAIQDDGLTVTVIGGNQNNKFCVSKYPRNQLLGYRWP